MRGTEDNFRGLYKTIFSHAGGQLDAYCDSIRENSVIMLDWICARLGAKFESIIPAHMLSRVAFPQLAAAK